MVAVDSVGASVVLDGASALNGGFPVDKGVLVDLEGAVGVARVLDGRGSDISNRGATGTTGSSATAATSVVVGLLTTVVLALVVLALVILALVVVLALAAAILLLAAAVVLLAATVVLLTAAVVLLATSVVLLTTAVVLLTTAVVLLATSVVLLAATLVVVGVVVGAVIVLLAATVVLLTTASTSTGTSIGTGTGTSISAGISAGTSTSTSTAASVVVALTDGEVLAVLLRAALGDRHENGLMVGSRRHGADAVVASGKSTGHISLNKTLAVAGIVDTLEEDELLGIKRGLGVKRVASVLDGDVGVTNDPAVSTELSGTAVVGARGVGESAEVEVGDVELDGEGLANTEVLEVLGRENHSGDHVLHGGDVTHNNTVARTATLLEAVGEVLTSAEVDEVGLVNSSLNLAIGDSAVLASLLRTSLNSIGSQACRRSGITTALVVVLVVVVGLVLSLVVVLVVVVLVIVVLVVVLATTETISTVVLVLSPHDGRAG